MRMQYLKKLVNLDINKSAGPDQIHPRVLYELRNEIAFPLKLIFEQTIKEEKLPTDWRSGNISAIYKKGSKLGNYRPISLTCICCKLLESIIRDHIVEFFFLVISCSVINNMDSLKVAQQFNNF